MHSASSFFGSRGNSGRASGSGGASRLRHNSSGTPPESSQTGQTPSQAPRSSGNVVVSSRELGALFDGLKALTDLVKKQHREIEIVSGTVRESRQEMSALREELQELRASFHTYGSQQE